MTLKERSGTEEHFKACTEGEITNGQPPHAIAYAHNEYGHLLAQLGRTDAASRYAMHTRWLAIHTQCLGGAAFNLGVSACISRGLTTFGCDVHGWQPVAKVCGGRSHLRARMGQHGWAGGF